MRIRIVTWALLVVAAILVVQHNAGVQAQGQNALVGVWERISLKNAEGVVTQPPGPAAFAIFSANGYFSQTTIPTGRNKVDKPLDQMTREELLGRFQAVVARRGTYVVSGSKLTRKDVSHTDPNIEGTETVQDFRIEGDVLILTTPGNKAEARFQRVK